jgi:hypothetical protein
MKMAHSVLQRAAQMRALATRMRGHAAETHLILYQAKLEAAARDLEREAAKLDHYRKFAITAQPRRAG